MSDVELRAWANDWCDVPGGCSDLICAEQRGYLAGFVAALDDKARLRDENARLRKLVEESRRYIDPNGYRETKEVADLLDAIDSALGKAGT